MKHIKITKVCLREREKNISLFYREVEIGSVIKDCFLKKCRIVSEVLTCEIVIHSQLSRSSTARGLVPVL